MSDLISSGDSFYPSQVLSERHGRSDLFFLSHLVCLVSLGSQSSADFSMTLKQFDSVLIWPSTPIKSILCRKCLEEKNDVQSAGTLSCGTAVCRCWWTVSRICWAFNKYSHSLAKPGSALTPLTPLCAFTEKVLSLLFLSCTIIQMTKQPIVCSNLSAHLLGEGMAKGALFTAS